MSHRTDGKVHRSATDSEILWSAFVTFGSGFLGIVLLITGYSLIGIGLLAVLSVGFGRSLGGNLLWRDLD